MTTAEKRAWLVDVGWHFYGPGWGPAPAFDHVAFDPHDGRCITSDNHEQLVDAAITIESRRGNTPPQRPTLG